MMFFGSICALIASALIYFIPRESWPLSVESFLYEMEYNLLAVKEVLYDWINAKYNKKVNTQQTGRVAIVTGGSRGLGLEVVKMLMELDMEVIIACRTPSAGEKAIKEIRDSGIKTGKAKVYKLDNASIKSVKQFSEQVKKDYKEIHVLINNAGVMFCPYEETEDGFEQQWGVNYLSHFLLTSHLLPLLSEGGRPGNCTRVINVSSCAQLLGRLNFEDTNTKDRFITKAAYARSKLAQQIFTNKLQNLLEKRELNVQSYSVHPGLVLTDLFKSSYVWSFRALFYILFKTPEQGAMPIVYTALHEGIEAWGGLYISNCRASRIHSSALNPSIQDKLFNLSLQQVQLKDYFQYL